MDNIGIIAAMDIELKFLRDNMDIIKEETKAGFKFYICEYKNLNLILTECGIGKVNAACCTQILIDKFKVTNIINTGIAGSLNNKVKICDTVISDIVTYYDVRKIQMKNSFPFQEFFVSDKTLVDLAVKSYKKVEFNEYNYYVGKIATGDSFVSEKNLKDIIKKDYNPLCVEMEGAAIAHIAYINKIPFVIIRSISDNADDKSEVSYAEFEKLSSKNSAKLVINMLDLIDKSYYL